MCFSSLEPTLRRQIGRWPRVRKKQDEKYRIAYLSPIPRNAPTFVALFDELRQFGFIEDQNLTIDHRDYGHHIELLSKYADELFGIPADVIVALGDPAIRALQQPTKTIPILALTAIVNRNAAP